MNAHPKLIEAVNSAQTPGQTKRLALNFGGSSCAGVRPQNQDAFAVHHSVDSHQLLHKGVVACIADGVSCSQNGQLASQLCVTQFIEDYLSAPESWGVKHAATKVLNALNIWLNHHSQQTALRHNGYVTTFSALVFKSNRLHLFHVGDSRVYRLRAGELILLSKDHSHQGFGEKGFLTRALGMDSHLEVDYQCHEVQLGDRYLLTTDGVHENLALGQLTDVVAQKDNLEVLARQLTSMALAEGSQDNNSCLLLQVHSLPYVDAPELTLLSSQKVIPPVMSVGNTIDDFEVLKVLYSGTRSHIYLVKPQGTDDVYVLKAPSLNFSEDGDYLASFVREQWVGQRTQHPSLMKVYPSESPFLYHLCEYISGQTLRQWMYDNPAADFCKVRAILEEIVIAVRALQRMGVVHRDIKPENLMLTPDDKVVLIDYGAAQADGLAELTPVTQEALPLGAVGYIAPEYLQTGVASHQADIFSIGVVVYEMLTGKLPYTTGRSLSINNHSRRDWCYISCRQYRESVPLWLDLALEKACHPDTRVRYQSMSEMLLDMNSPNQQMVQKHQSLPFIEREPIMFWKGLSVLLLMIVVLQALLL
ncbi:bifunctional protein-serine/threonine kinase/phosphatase [Shewanella marisflavi]|uniref:bifunctional protein-serine/threonine kinase/phosphatase n=1 Tax=Shewanella marisflavi TaxID=260364 RepID=UPI00200BD04D|nr:bifunctional protein-serine/threonine kinase/phosphatase [Shewanella marisflavi]MCL1042906.1 bifunctional protein-serine/threonine kinase/phosphatase [Shewanella marisflavi]